MYSGANTKKNDPTCGSAPLTLHVKTPHVLKKVCFPCNSTLPDDHVVSVPGQGRALVCPGFGDESPGAENHPLQK